MNTTFRIFWSFSQHPRSSDVMLSESWFCLLWGSECYLLAVNWNVHWLAVNWNVHWLAVNWNDLNCFSINYHGLMSLTQSSTDSEEWEITKSREIEKIYVTSSQLSRDVKWSTNLLKRKGVMILFSSFSAFIFPLKLLVFMSFSKRSKWRISTPWTNFFLQQKLMIFEK